MAESVITLFNSDVTTLKFCLEPEGEIFTLSKDQRCEIVVEDTSGVEIEYYSGGISLHLMRKKKVMIDGIQVR